MHRIALSHSTVSGSLRALDLAVLERLLRRHLAQGFG